MLNITIIDFSMKDDVVWLIYNAEGKEHDDIEHIKISVTDGRNIIIQKL